MNKCAKCNEETNDELIIKGKGTEYKIYCCQKCFEIFYNDDSQTIKGFFNLDKKRNV